MWPALSSTIPASPSHKFGAEPPLGGRGQCQSPSGHIQALIFLPHRRFYNIKLYIAFPFLGIVSAKD